jgi:hypothetical protein
LRGARGFFAGSSPAASAAGSAAFFLRAFGFFSP